MIRPVAAVIFVLAFAAAASAQWPRAIEVSGAYSYLHDPRDDTNLPAGWVAAAAVPVAGWLSVAGEVGQHRRSVSGFGSDLRLSIQAAMAGPRASARLGPFVEFVQVLAGVVRGSGSAFDVTIVNTAFAVQPGIGLDYPLASRWSARVQVDVRFVRGRSDGAAPGDQFRALTGLVYAFR